ncbi:MAG: thiol:disulfide interchange protein [Paraglaciecola sp.]|jgi:thiol:disulfide interchange protein
MCLNNLEDKINMGIEPSPSNKTQSASLLKIAEPVEVKRRMASGDTFVVNVVTAWCPDCTERQTLHIGSFAQKMKSHGIDVLQVNVQLLRGYFIGVEHEKITTQFGGHGYPRTVLIKHGNVADQNNVEIITEDTLSELARKFIQIIAKS